MKVYEILTIEATPDPKVIEIQKALKAKGFDLGNYGPNKDGIDGIMGPTTRAAMAADKRGDSPSKTPPPSTNPDSSSGTELMPTKGQITGKYGRMVTGPKGNKIPHPGVDIGAPQGTPVVAPGDGKVIFAANAGTAGNLVELITLDGEKHRFMHLSKILVSRGDVVKKGQQVGLVGSTGFSSGPHLHWEKYASSGKQLDPLA
jgi:murein DD-endopeptidase MepM/ murein hydrolase activator NlpD